MDLAMHRKQFVAEGDTPVGFKKKKKKKGLDA